jgi:hypothetical protein
MVRVRMMTTTTTTTTMMMIMMMMMMTMMNHDATPTSDSVPHTNTLYIQSPPSPGRHRAVGGSCRQYPRGGQGTHPSDAKPKSDSVPHTKKGLCLRVCIRQTLPHLECIAPPGDHVVNIREVDGERIPLSGRGPVAVELGGGNVSRNPRAEAEADGGFPPTGRRERPVADARPRVEGRQKLELRGVSEQAHTETWCRIQSLSTNSTHTPDDLVPHTRAVHKWRR